MRYFVEQSTFMVLAFSTKYFRYALLLFLTEVIIALYIHDSIIRPYIGDFLVVILLYCMVKCVLNIDVTYIAFGVLLFSYLIEILQFFKLVEILGLEEYPLANIIIGTSFAWIDMLAYTLGILAVLTMERKIFKWVIL